MKTKRKLQVLDGRPPPPPPPPPQKKKKKKNVLDNVRRTQDISREWKQTKTRNINKTRKDCRKITVDRARRQLTKYKSSRKARSEHSKTGARTRTTSISTRTKKHWCSEGKGSDWQPRYGKLITESHLQGGEQESSDYQLTSALWFLLSSSNRGDLKKKTRTKTNSYENFIDRKKPYGSQNISTPPCYNLC